VLDELADEAINIGSITDRERKVVHAWSPSLVEIVEAGACRQRT
jgi:hypothetical protein